ncbi:MULTISPECIES: rhodanese-like domain-containing protein [Zunongwangia]|jgi:rhodanese-related sulfurtransferase|uniref:Rhodanese-like domain protein n=2 Tax=Zunongwangia profunda TaxID=398743 RepID=D5BCI3_ZUNPS|nr:rhodanese-like domain-containing protein [Zunongwangia profunda]ADF50496.1 rhodanese-like domain protein [Zunongwangia profunda SM-A87]MAS70592.1 rhodanese-like domain-containing protein [Zunongwangia sp.]HCV79488.1 rhodanese-like domain-containing protein [Zunongwangia profunda]|tara:strand:- start:3238 stop:3615 length:378 start_codon:yes stop_codon:yes gene_type:complete
MNPIIPAIVIVILLGSYFVLKNYNNRKRDQSLKGKNISQFQILDVRTPREFKQGHIKNAINFPLGIINSDSLKKLNKELNYITYCAHGIRSVKASKILKENGFKVTNGGSIKDLQKLIAYSENRN